MLHLALLSGIWHVLSSASSSHTINRYVANCISYATLLNVIRTDNAFWAAADGLRGTGSLTSDTACKLHETPFGLVGKAGATQGFSITGIDYSTDLVLFETLQRSQNAAEFKKLLSKTFAQQIRNQMSYLLRLPSLSDEQLAYYQYDTSMPEVTKHWWTRHVVLITAETGMLKLEHLMVAPESFPLRNGRHQYFVRMYDWINVDATNFLKQDQKHPSLHQFAANVVLGESDAWITAHPQETLERMLATGRRDKPREIGPPHRIACVSARPTDDSRSFRAEIEWVVKDPCPEWNFALYRLDYFKQES